MSVEAAIARRRSVRSYRPQPLSLAQLSQVLWAAQGLTSPRLGLRATPSAGATYPLEIYIIVGEKGVEGLEAGVYYYLVEGHALELRHQGDRRVELASAALGQDFIRQAPAAIVIAAVFQRTTAYYGRWGESRYVPMEVGHAGQNIHLQAEALGLVTVAVGAFDDEAVRRVVGLASETSPLYIMPVGKVGKSP